MSCGKRVSLLVGGVAVLVLALSAVVLGPVLKEEYYLNRLRHGSEEERQAAANALAEMGSVRALPVLLTVEAFAACGPDPLFEIVTEHRDEGVRVLLDALRSEVAGTRYAATYILGSKSVWAGNELVVAECLVAALRDKDSGVRKRAAGSLISLAMYAKETVKHSKEAVRNLMPLLTEKGGQVTEGYFYGWDGSIAFPPKYFAAIALGEIGAAAREAVPLLQALVEESELAAPEARKALANILGEQ